MARTRRRRSYRKSRRWNPDAVPAVVAAAPTKANPHTYIKRLPDGSTVRVTTEGKVTVLDSDGSVHDRWSIKEYEIPRLLRNLKAAKRANKYDYRADAVADEYNTVSMNPRRRKVSGYARAVRKQEKAKRALRRARHAKGNSSKRVRRFNKWRVAAHGWDNGLKFPAKRPRHGVRRSKRSNPAQFPPPYFSAMSNPRRGKKRSARGKVRRNSPIRKKDARALKRVLRTHHYRCR